MEGAFFAPKAKGRVLTMTYDTSPASPQRIELSGRESLTVSGVEDVDRFCFESGEKRSRLRRAVPKRHFELSLWLTMPYRVALTDTERVISDTSESEVRRLGSIQPADGSAGFVNHLLNAIRKGGELALIRVERKRDEERVMELEDGVMDEIRLYLDEYIAGSQDTVPENRVMLAPPEPPELHWLRR